MDKPSEAWMHCGPMVRVPEFVERPYPLLRWLRRWQLRSVAGRQSRRQRPLGRGLCDDLRKSECLAIAGCLAA